MLTLATTDRSSLLGLALTEVIAYAADDRFDGLLREALGQRKWLEDIRRLDRGVGNDAFAEVERIYRDHFNVRHDADRAGLQQEAASCIPQSQLQRLVTCLAEGAVTDIDLADALRPALTASSAEARVAALRCYFLKSDGGQRQRLMTNAVRKPYPELGELAERAQSRFMALDEEMKALNVVLATVAIARLADHVMQGYVAAKSRRAALDFEDLIVRTAQPAGDTRIRGVGAVQARRGARPHPGRRIAGHQSDAVAGGARAGERVLRRYGRQRPPCARIFAVGDEKQSIYSFQGARPELFEEMGEHFATAAKEAGQPWQRIPLTLSFRTVKPVLSAVDDVFANPEVTPGVGAAEGRIHHEAKRFGQSGLVEIWPTEKHEEADAPDAWSPLTENGTGSPCTAAGDPHRTHDQALARHQGAARRRRAAGRAGRHPDSRAQACAVRRRDGLGAEGARHSCRRRRPPHADRSDRRAGSHRARRFPDAAGRRPVACSRARKARCSVSMTTI